MAEFVPSPGFVNCSKCGGWQVLDYTKRGANKDPICELDYRDCDKCEGQGQIRLEPLPINKPTKRQKKQAEIDNLPINDIGDWEAKARPAASSISNSTCWHINKETVWGEIRCTDCGSTL
jgi:hypothetical protein